MRVFACYNRNAIADIIVPVPDINDGIAVRCLQNLKECTPEPHNVIIVESSGKDFSFTKSINTGVENARTELYITFNDDVFPKTGWLTGIIEAFRDYPKLGICGVVQYNDANTISHLGGRFDPKSCIAYNLPGPDMNDPAVVEYFKSPDAPPSRGKQIITSDWLNGALLAMPKKVWDELGGLDTRFQMYWDDVDICLRARLKGYDVGIHRGIKVLHKGGVTPNETGVSQLMTWVVMRKKLVEMGLHYFKEMDIREIVDAAESIFRINQVKAEITTLAEIVYALDPKVIVEIGTERGGTLFTWSKVSPHATIISIDIARLPILTSGDVHLITGNTHDLSTLIGLKAFLGERPVDFLFIDGDHSFDGVCNDYVLYESLVRPRGVIALHDICVHPPSTGCFVHDFWEKVKVGKNYMEIIERRDQGWAGIGVIFK